MKRIAPRGDFRANVHRGARTEKVKLTPEERAIALRAAKEVGLRVAGVDLLRSKHGPVVVEVNSSPGLRGIEAKSEVDVATRIVEYVERKSRSPKRHGLRGGATARAGPTWGCARMGAQRVPHPQGG
jgi:ribosomal protein S6--L-glutamate ligase